MPKLLYARAPVNEQEDRQVRRLAGSRHAPGDWMVHARMVVRSWAGERTTTIAAALRCHPLPAEFARALLSSSPVFGTTTSAVCGATSRHTCTGRVICSGPKSARVGTLRHVWQTKDVGSFA